MRILFFGTAEFAVPTLSVLAGAPSRTVVAVVTQPDKPAGRGQHESASPVKAAALRLGLPILQPRRVRANSFVDTVRDLQPDAIVLAAFGQIIPTDILDVPPLGPINVHGSLLPAYRGAAPIQHAILDGQTETGVTTMWMDAGLDTGDILLSERVEIASEATSGTLTERMAVAGAGLLAQTLDLLESGTCPRRPQHHSAATWAPALTADDAVLAWDEEADCIVNRVRAMSPRPGAFTHIGGRRLKVWSAKRGSGLAAEPGTVCAVTRAGAEVASKSGSVLLIEVQAENARRMSAADWARGVRLAVGARFET